MQCSLCDVFISGRSEAEPLFQNELAAVTISDDWAVAGHLVIVASRHVENSADLSPAEFYGFFDVFRAAERALLEATEAERVVVMKLGLAVPHLHHHLYPFSKTATREEVFAAINMTSRQELEGEERRAFTERLAALIARELG